MFKTSQKNISKSEVIQRITIIQVIWEKEEEKNFKKEAKNSDKKSPNAKEQFDELKRNSSASERSIQQNVTLKTDYRNVNIPVLKVNAWKLCVCKNKTHEMPKIFGEREKIKWKIIQIDALRELALWLPAVIYSYSCISSDFDQFWIGTIDSETK